MANINYGAQTLNFDYKEELKGKEFNKVFDNIVPTGIYSGFTLTKVTNTSVRVGIGECFIKDTTNSLSVHVKTSATEDITTNSSIPYIVFRLIWVDAVNNYMDMKAVNEADILTDDIIVGQCIFDVSDMDTVMDYARRETASLKTLEDNKDALKVLALEPISAGFQVLPGKAIINNNYIEFGGATITGVGPTDPGTPTAKTGRIDVVYLDDTGTVGYASGDENDTPTPPSEPLIPANVMILAKITRAEGRADIKGNEIEQYAPDRELAKNVDPKYNVVIESGEDLENRISKVNTAVVNKIYIKSGTYLLTGAGIDLATQNILLIEGERNPDGTSGVILKCDTGFSGTDIFTGHKYGEIKNLNYVIDSATFDAIGFIDVATGNETVAENILVNTTVAYGATMVLFNHIEGKMENCKATDSSGAATVGSVGIQNSNNIYRCGMSYFDTGFESCTKVYECLGANGLKGFQSCTPINSSTASSNGVYGFNSSTHLVGCFSDNNGTTGFNSCDYLSNCASTTDNVGYNGCESLSGCSSTSSSSSGFSGCSHLTGCTSTSSTTNGFSSCNFLSGCYSTLNSNNGYISCTGVSSCYAYLNTQNGFYFCENVASCISQTNTTNGYNLCKYMTSNSANGNTLQGFLDCINLTSSYSISNGDWGYKTCQVMGFNRASGNVSGTYTSCFAGYSSVGATANTSTGGYNL